VISVGSKVRARGVATHGTVLQLVTVTAGRVRALVHFSDKTGGFDQFWDLDRLEELPTTEGT